MRIKKIRNIRLHQLLIMDLLPWRQRMEAGNIRTLVHNFDRALRDQNVDLRQMEEWELAREFVLFLARQMDRARIEIGEKEDAYQQLTHRYNRSGNSLERRSYLLAYAAELGASRFQLSLDKKAFRRYFDFDAITDRYQYFRRCRERFICFCLRRLGVLGEFVFKTNPQAALVNWQRLSLEKTCAPFWSFAGNAFLRKDAFAAFTRVFRALPAEIRANGTSNSTHALLYREAMSFKEQVWHNVEAIRLLIDISVPSFETVVEHWFSNAESDPGDAIFIRARVCITWGNHLKIYPQLTRLAAVLFADPSPFVRQSFAEALTRGEPEFADRWIEKLLVEDKSPQVRAKALLELEKAPLTPERVVALWSLVFVPASDRFELRTAMKVAMDLSSRWAEERPELCQQFIQALVQVKDWEVHPSIQREASKTSEAIWSLCDSEARALLQVLGELVHKIPPGGSVPVPVALRRADRHTLGRVLSVVAQSDFGLDLEPGILRERLRRGPVFGFRWWRLWHELKGLDPAKRQGISHTRGRISRGMLRAPSAILAELAEAKVPGEPLFLSEEGGWRPYLPLVEDILSTLDFNLMARPVRFYTSEGVTLIKPPGNPFRRFMALVRLSLRYTEYVALRKWAQASSHQANAYMKALQDLGFRVELEGLSPQVAPAAGVARFFPGFLAIPDATLFRIRDYLGSVYGNNIYELIGFLGGAMLLFFGKQGYLNQRIRTARYRLPLVIGGWGTRGKSGTERLKAALFNGLGYSVFSKTTGCEAMFVYCQPFDRSYELALFRPYDKATIWEQGDVVRMADKMGAEVFLWECMGLNPGYVNILQRQWMRDDLATITNTFPDHEDIQGPAGYNIPLVMTEFIPKKSHLLTTEESMYPILDHAARRLGTSIRGYGWLEAGLLTPDVLKRFPYEEHPYNIALVAGLAEELGIGRDFALKEMADKVVPDLGVLKTFPPAPVETRRLIFSNGMSANERLGCLTNWSRLGFDLVDPAQEPDVWVTSVVNNRFDRISRSQMFADIMVRDISVDKHVIIGSNLAGMSGYLEESWAEYAAGFKIFGAVTPALERLKMLARQQRVPLNPEMVINRLRVMLQALLGEGFPQQPELLALWDNPEGLSSSLGKISSNENLPSQIPALMGFHNDYLKRFREYTHLVELVSRGGNEGEVEKQCLSQAGKWFMESIYFVWDFHASGEKIIHTIAQITPFGFTNRIMGLQNIKGTGLDFAYRWLAWGRCYELCTLLESEEDDVFAAALEELMTFREFGVASAEFVAQALGRARHAPVAQKDRFQAQLAVIESRFTETIREIRHNLGKTIEKPSRMAAFFGLIETFLDAGDAVKRRKQADSIYRDLVSMRISRARARTELAVLNKRQKGGWLWKKVQAFFSSKDRDGDSGE